MPIEHISLQEYKIQDGATDYPDKHDAAMDGQQNKINEMVDATNAAVETVSQNIDNINAVNANEANINAVAENITSVVAVAENEDNINAAVAALPEIEAVGENIANVNAVAANQSNINTVAESAEEVAAVAGNATNINAVAAIAEEVATVAGIATSVQVVAENVDLISDNAANIATVAGISDDVAAVAQKSDEVQQVADAIPAIDTVVENITDIQSAQENAQSALDSKNAAAGSEGLAEKWAEEAEDVEVEPGQYSAKHHALKAAESDASAADNAAAAEQAKLDAEAIVYGGGFSTTPAPGNVPIALSNGRLADGWLGPNSISNPKALASAIHMTAASSGGYIRALDSFNNNLGTSDFTLVWRGALAASTLARLVFKHLSGNNRFGLFLTSTGVLTFYAQIGGTVLISAASTVAVPAGSPWSVNEYAVSVVRETESAPGTIVFAANGCQVGDPVVIPAGTPLAYSVATTLGFCLDSGASGRAESVTHAAAIYNRALSVAELLDRAVNGVNPVDIGARTTPAYQSDFSSGTDGFSVLTSGSVDGNIDGISGQDNVLRHTSGGGNSSIQRSGVFLPSGTRARVRFRAYRPSSNTTATGYSIRTSAQGTVTWESGNIGNFNFIPADTWTNFEGVMLGLDNSSIRMWQANSTALSGGTSDGDIIYIRDFEVVSLGVVARYETDGIQAGGQWLDSANGNHALVPSSGATVLRPSRTNQQRGTNSWSATSEMQYVGGFNQAVFPVGSAITTLDIHSTGSVSVHIGDGVDADRYGASIALVAGRNRVSLLTPFNDGSNLKLTLTPTASFSGTLKTTCDYKLQEA